MLVFTRTKHRAERLAKQLHNAGYRVASLQGNLSQRRRQAALDGFRDGHFQILVATDIAARGIDVSRISHVINYDIPDTADAYTHRIGRTGRAAKTGDAFTLVTGEDEGVVRDIERVLGGRLERRRIDGFDYKAPAPPRQEQPSTSRDNGRRRQANPTERRGSAPTSAPTTYRRRPSRTNESPSRSNRAEHHTS